MTGIPVGALLLIIILNFIFKHA